MAKSIDQSGIRLTIRRLLRRPKYRYMVVNRIVPHAPWLVLIALAAFLYKARIFAESGFYFAQFINNQTFWIECQRIVSGIPQIIPLIGIWLGIEINYVLLIYSLSHIVFFYFLFLFVYYGLRDRRSGLLIILSQTVGIVHSFFIPVYELFYGVPLLITFYAIWRLPFRYNVLYILLLLEVFILLSHPLAFLLFAFLLLYDYTRESAKPFKFYLPIILLFLGAATFKYLVMCDFEMNKLAWQFNYSENKQYLNLISPAYYKTLGLFLLQHYAEVLIAFIFLVIMLFNQKQWYKLVVVSGTFALYIFLVTSANTLTPSRYMEQVMYPFVPIVFIPLIYGFTGSGRQGRFNIAVFLISALVVYRLTVIYFGSEPFQKRVAQMEQLIETARQKGGSKFIVSKDVADHGYSIFNWSYPIETMLLSAIDGNDLPVTLVTDEDFRSGNTGAEVKANQFIFRRGEIKNYEWLNKTYFHFDIGPYRSLNDTTPNKNIQFIANKLRISIGSKNIYPAMDTVWIPVKIVNSGKSALYSGANNKIFISYFWVLNNDVLNWNEIRTPLQADIAGTIQQDIKVAVPNQKGRMQLKVDLIANDNWLGINSREDVLVY